MEDAAIIGAISGVLTAVVAFGTFWLTIGGKMQKSLSTSENALQIAAEVENKLEATEGRITALGANFALYRENAVEKFVTHQYLGNLERRLIEGLEGVNTRLDQLFNAAFKNGR